MAAGAVGSTEDGIGPPQGPSLTALLQQPGCMRACAWTAGMLRAASGAVIGSGIRDARRPLCWTFFRGRRPRRPPQPSEPCGPVASPAPPLCVFPWLCHTERRRQRGTGCQKGCRSSSGQRAAAHIWAASLSQRACPHVALRPLDHGLQCVEKENSGAVRWRAQEFGDTARRCGWCSK